MPPEAFSISPFFATARVGEGALLVAEQLTLQQGVRQGGAVQADERRLGARAIVVNGLGQYFLAGSALALNEDGGVVALRGAARHLENLAH